MQEWNPYENEYDADCPETNVYDTRNENKSGRIINENVVELKNMIF